MNHPYIPEIAEIVDIKNQSVDTKTYTLHLTDKKAREEFSPKPGQFVLLSIPGAGEAAFSLSSVPSEKGFDSTIRTVGSFTKVLDRYDVGAKIGVRGPYGTAWPLDKAKGKSILIVAGGIGLPPLRPVIESVQKDKNRYGELEILYGARTPADGMFKDEYEKWTNNKGTRLQLTVDKVPPGVDWKHSVGVVTGLFDEMRTDPSSSIVMTCGPEIMMRFVVNGLLARNFTTDQIYVSLERRMECGLAHCGHCQIGPKFVCKDGPVFRYSDIVGLPDLEI